jgi:hypothetical protein
MAEEKAPAPTPAPEWVTLVSSDGFEFIIQREPAMVAGTIRRMLDPKCTCNGAFWTRSTLTPSDGFKEAVTNTCHFENIPCADQPPTVWLLTRIAASFWSRSASISITTTGTRA